MDKKRLKKLIRGREKPSRAGSTKEAKSVNDSVFAPGDIVIYDSITKDSLWKDENDGKIYLCLGDAESPELGNMGTLLSGSFPDLRIIAVLQSDGDICYFLPDELSHSGDPNE